MKIIMIYDQIQSGAGIKDDHMVPLGATKDPVGPAVMMEPYLKKVGGRVVACLYCGDGFYEANADEVSRKLCAMVKKLQPDVVICGPAFNYLGYGKMAARVALDIENTVGTRYLRVCPGRMRRRFLLIKTRFTSWRTPKKGGFGLNEALEGMCLLAAAMVNKDREADVAAKYCFK